MIVRVEERFEAAHRLLKHDGRCRFLHGHSYVAQVELSGEVQPETGMVVDFRKLKTAVRTLTEHRLDHACLLQAGDPLCQHMTPALAVEGWYPQARLLLLPFPPTAELLAGLLLGHVAGVLDVGLSDLTVTIHETVTSSVRLLGRAMPPEGLLRMAYRHGLSIGQEERTDAIPASL